MSLYDDMERCDLCMARLRPGGCDRWGTEIPPCEQDYNEDEEEEEDEGGSEDPT